MKPHPRTLTLTPKQRKMVVQAIDSHVYWQLSDEGYRNDGCVLEPGSDDPDTVEQIVAFEALQTLFEEEV